MWFNSISARIHYYVKYGGQTAKSPGSLLIISPLFVYLSCLDIELFKGELYPSRKQPVTQPLTGCLQRFSFSFK